MKVFVKSSILVGLSGKKESLASWGVCLVGVDIVSSSGWGGVSAWEAAGRVSLGLRGEDLLANPQAT